MRPIDGDSENQTPTRIRYRVLGLAAGLAVITYLDRVCFGAAAGSIAAALGLASATDLKWAFTAFTLAYGLFEIPTGRLGDRWGARGTLIRIVLLWSLFTALTGAAGLEIGGTVLIGLSGLVAIRFLFGAGEAGAYPNLARVIHDWFPRSDWERVQGYLWMSGRIAGGLTPLVWMLLVSGTGSWPGLVNWRGAFLLFGVIGIGWCLIFATVFRDRPDDHPSCNDAERRLIGRRGEATDRAEPIPWGAMFRSRSLWSLCLMYSLVTYGWIFDISYFPAYFDRRFEVPETAIWGAVYKGAPLWVGAIGCVLGGYAVGAAQRLTGDRISARRLIGTAAMLLCAGCWFGARTTDDVHRFCLFVSLAGFGVDLTLGAAWASCQDLGGRHAGVIAACMNTAGTAGASLASWLTGTIVQRSIASTAAEQAIEVDRLDPAVRLASEMSGYDAVFISYAAVYLVAAICWWGIDPRRPIGSETVATDSQDAPPIAEKT